MVLDDAGWMSWPDIAEAGNGSCAYRLRRGIEWCVRWNCCRFRTSIGIGWASMVGGQYKREAQFQTNQTWHGNRYTYEGANDGVIGMI